MAAFLDSSRSAVSRRIRAGIEAMRGRLAKSGVPLAGLGLLGGALRGSEAPPAESLVQKILEAGKSAMATEGALPPTPDALDAALAAPVRSLPPLAAIGAAAAIAIGVLAALGYFFLLRPGIDRGGEPPGRIAAAPAALPAAPGPKAEEKAPPPAPPPAAGPPTEVVGTVRDEDGRPIASAAVYLAFHLPAEEFWYEFGGGPDTPGVETPRYPGVPGTLLEEKTIVVPRPVD